MRYHFGMRLVTFEAETQLGRVRRLGALSGDSVIDLQSAYLASLLEQRVEAREASRLAAISLPPAMEAFITAGRSAMSAARQAVAFIEGGGAMPGVPTARKIVMPLAAVRLLAPLRRPNSLRDFIAFEDHAKAGAARRAEQVHPIWYERPVYYKGNHRSILGPHDSMQRPTFTEELDFEMEVACIVGEKMLDVSADDAAKGIFGFMIMNDWSARDIQRGEMAARLGPSKSKDFATSFGPWICTADELGPHPDLEMIALVNGEQVCRARSSDAFWKFPQIIEFVSMGETVWPTDVLGSGTPFGGCMLDHSGPYLQPGDVVELQLGALGTLTTTVTG